MSESEKLLIDWANKAIEYGVQNVPAVVQQYLTWWFWMHFIYICLGLVIAIGVVCVVRHECKQKFPWDIDEREAAILSFLGTFLGSTISSLLIIFNTLDIVKVKVAPAAYIIDKLIESTK